MNRQDLQQLAEIRIREAEVLLDSGCYEGAYYLAGYSLECALKACIAAKTNQGDFPDKELVRKVFTHNLTELIRLAGLEEEWKGLRASPEFERNWAVVKDWSEENRYVTSVAEVKARDFFSAVVDGNNGVLTWLKKWW